VPKISISDWNQVLGTLAPVEYNLKDWNALEQIGLTEFNGMEVSGTSVFLRDSACSGYYPIEKSNRCQISANPTKARQAMPRATA